MRSFKQTNEILSPMKLKQNPYKLGYVRIDRSLSFESFPFPCVFSSRVPVKVFLLLTDDRDIGTMVKFDSNFKRFLLLSLAIPITFEEFSSVVDVVEIHWTF